MPMKRRIFVSLPSDESLADHPEQNAVKWGIVDEIVKLGYVPEIFRDSRDEAVGEVSAAGWSAGNFDRIIRRCCGCVIIGLPRWHLFDGDKRVQLASEFTHYEGAVASSLKLPVLVVRQEGVQRRVFFDPSYDGHVAVMPALVEPSWLATREFRRPFERWQEDVAKRRDVFFGYCGSSDETARLLKQYLTEELHLTVLDWKTDFKPGHSILSQIQDAADRCGGAVLLFTRDDNFADGSISAPRDNVVFEAGYFSSAKGKDRVLIVRQQGAKMPADLGGDIYAALPHASDIGPLREVLERFVDAL
jgi:hypothetical protein